HHLADEALAEVASRLLEERVRTQYTPTRPWRPWVGTILRNFILDRLRERARHPHVPVEGLALGGRRQTPDLALDLADCLARLTQEQRGLLERRYLDGARQGEIAADLGRSDAWVSRRMEEAREALRRCLQNKGYTVL